ncbi:lysozyme [Salmonella enterica]|uniref:Lysozyme n=1 Tax=Salmonella diarizonae TaxID=59204 RepID=A0A702GC55_SALDZ|nr:lysozyme [Salmonella enterica]ECC3214329.1 lysozyme [Salmonella enterica subsp. diarizonae]EHG3720521.1 lysozyme [Salmonella enterica subsp. diarizonae serovar 11:k:z53]EKR1692423.1 lysozyme [Salmonella enterica subsp. diarizonae serovar 6,7,14:k:z50]EAA9598990.1 lysozyme [Salmonella enterica]
MKISNNGINIIKSSEVCRLRAYKNIAGKWAIGYGWTHPVDGVCIQYGMIIAQETADRLLKTELVARENDVRKLVKTQLSQGQFDALVSFAYSLGSSVLSTSLLLRKLNSGDYAGAADEFLRWNNIDGKVQSRLIRRRKEERVLFLS